ncbi:hypothetical protein Tco_0338877, partial [Tanacetum coccineum]
SPGTWCELKGAYKIEIKCIMLICKRLSKGVEYLVEASEAEAIAKTLAAAKARQSNREVDLPDRDYGAEATPSGKISTLIKPKPDVRTISAPAGIRLHHRVISTLFLVHPYFLY